MDYLAHNDENIFIIRGYAQPLNEKKIFNQFGTHLIKSGLATTIDNVLIKDQLTEYKGYLDESPEDTVIYVVFYDISNYGFLSSELQSRLASLLSLPKLRVISSIENCKIVLNWSLSIFIVIKMLLKCSTLSLSTAILPASQSPNSSDSCPCLMKRRKRHNSKSAKSGRVSIETNVKSQLFWLKTSWPTSAPRPHKKTTSLSSSFWTPALTR